MPSIGPTIGIKGENEYKAALKRIRNETKQLNTEMELMKSRFKATDTQMERNKAVSESLTKQMEKQQGVIEKRNALLKAAETRYEKISAKVEDYQKRLANGETTIEDSKGRTKSLNNELDKQKVALERAGAAVADHKEKIAAAELEYEKLTTEMGSLTNAAELVGEKLQGIGGVVEGVGDKLTQYISAPLAALGTFSVKGASDITDGLAKIYTIADKGVVPMDDMRQGLMDLSDTTARSVTELEAAAYQALSASISTEDTLGFVKDASNLARAGFLDVSGSVDILTTIMNAYHRSADEAEKISSVLVKTQDDGKTTVAELAHSMGTVIPTAAAYGVSLEQLASSYVVLTKQGIDTSRATTFLNSMFTELEKEGKGVSLVLEEETGKSFAQLMGEGKTVADVLQILMDHVGGNSEKFAQLWGNVRAGRGALAIINGGTEAFNTELTKLENSSGQVARNLGILETPSLKAQRAINKLKNSSYDLGQEALEMLLPYLEKGVELVDEFTQWVKSLSKAEKENIIKTAAMAAAAGPLLKIGGKLITGIGKFTSNVGAMNRIYRNVGSKSQALAKIIGDEKLGWSALTSTIGAAVAAYVALGIAAQYESQKHRDQLTSLYGLNEEQQQLIDSSYQLTEQWKETKQVSHDNAAAVGEQYYQVEQLTDKYNSLIDENGKVKDGQQLLADTIKIELADALGLELTEIDNLIEENGKFGRSMDEVIQKMKNEALMAGYKDQYLAAITGREEVQKKIIDLNDQLAQKEKDVESAARATQAAYDAYNNSVNETDAERQRLYQNYLDAIVTENAARESVRQTKEALDDQQTSYDDMTNTIGNYENAMKAMEEGNEHLSEEIKKIADNWVTAERGSATSLANQRKNIDREFRTMQKMVKEGAKGASVEALHELEYLKEQADKEWFDYIGPGLNANKEKTRKAVEQFMNEGVVQPTSKGMTQATNTADTGILKFADAINYGIKPVRSAMQGVIDNLLEVAPSKIKEMENVGWLYGDGFAKGLNRYPIKDTVRAWAGHIPGQTAYTLHEQSPSKLSQEYGWYWGEGLAIGITKTTGLVSTAAEQLANSATAMDGYLNYSGMNPYSLAGGMASASKSISAPISVNVTVNGNVDNYDELAETIADKINEQIIRKSEVFA